MTAPDFKQTARDFYQHCFGGFAQVEYVDALASLLADIDRQATERERGIADGVDVNLFVRLGELVDAYFWAEHEPSANRGEIEKKLRAANRAYAKWWAQNDRPYAIRHQKG